MYSYIRGELAEINLDHIVIDVNGIGYMVYISGQTFEYLPNIGQQIKVHTYLHIREDAMILYGFLTKDDLDMFIKLIGVSGIGPKGGLAVLSVLSADDLRFAILAGDAKAIAKAPGIGQKTAVKAILELKDKMKLEDAFEIKLEHQKENEVSGETVTGIRNEAVQALTALGYSNTEALKAVRSVKIEENMDVETVLKLSLKHISF